MRWLLSIAGGAWFAGLTMALASHIVSANEEGVRVPGFRINDFGIDLTFPANDAPGPITGEYIFVNTHGDIPRTLCHGVVKDGKANPDGTLSLRLIPDKERAPGTEGVCTFTCTIAVERSAQWAEVACEGQRRYRSDVVNYNAPGGLAMRMGIIAQQFAARAQAAERERLIPLRAKAEQAFQADEYAFERWITALMQIAIELDFKGKIEIRDLKVKWEEQLLPRVEAAFPCGMHTCRVQADVVYPWIQCNWRDSMCKHYPRLLAKEASERVTPETVPEEIKAYLEGQYAKDLAQYESDQKQAQARRSEELQRKLDRWDEEGREAQRDRQRAREERALDCVSVPSMCQ